MIYLVARGLRCPVNTRPTEYLASKEEVSKFFAGAICVEDLNPLDVLVWRYIKAIKSVEVIATAEQEEASIQGITRLVDTTKGPIKIGFSKLSSYYVYIKVEGAYMRGAKVEIQDFCLVNAMSYIPLDKSVGDGNIEILRHNKRKEVKSIKVVHNFVRTMLYVVDKNFPTVEQMKHDVKEPEPHNLTALVDSILMT